MTETTLCPECGSERTELDNVCPACGAAPAPEHRQDEVTGDIRGHDLEPYITLRYIAKLFKVLAVLIIVMLVGEVVTGLLIDGTSAAVTLLGEGTRCVHGGAVVGGATGLLMIDAATTCACAHPSRRNHATCIEAAGAGMCPGPRNSGVRGRAPRGLPARGSLAATTPRAGAGLPTSSSLARGVQALVADLRAPTGPPDLRRLYRKRVRSVAAMTDLGKKLRARLAASHAVRWPAVAERSHSADGTIKLLFRLDDGAAIESVFIPEERRRTICISTQAGCPLKCAFCLTGIAGYKRNLRPWEILGQVATVMEEAPSRELPGTRRDGMGEPAQLRGHGHALPC